MSMPASGASYLVRTTEVVSGHLTTGCTIDHRLNQDILTTEGTRIIVRTSIRKQRSCASHGRTEAGYEDLSFESPW